MNESKEKIWVSQMISADTRKLLKEICAVSRRSVPTEIELIVKEHHKKNVRK
jgi:hypothetical protein